MKNDERKQREKNLQNRWKHSGDVSHLTRKSEGSVVFYSNESADVKMIVLCVLNHFVNSFLTAVKSTRVP